jgi:hypothetical protein
MKKYSNTEPKTEDKRQNEIIRIQKKQNNFVMLDKGFLEDNRLSFKAKGILAYLLSKPDGWKVIVKDLINHSADGKKAIYSGLRELKQFGYYKKVPVRDESNRIISHWESVIYECPIEQEKNSEKSAISPLLTPFVYIDNVKIQNEDIQNGERNNNYNSNNKINNTDISINRGQVETESVDDEPVEQEMIDMIDNEDIEIIRETVADKICLSELITENPDKEEKVYELYQVICDVLTSHNTDKIRIAKQQISADKVKQIFSNLEKAHIIYVLGCLEKNGNNIKDNAKGYIITALYNSIHSIEYYKPQNQSAFKYNSEIKNKLGDDLMERAIKKSMKF